MNQLGNRLRRIAASAVALAVVGSLAVPVMTEASTASLSGMFKEQLAEQKMIGALMGATSSHSSWVTSISLGKVKKSGSTAIVPVTVHTSRSAVKGTLVLHRSSGVWYFYSIARGSHAAGISNASSPKGISTSVVSSAIKEQKAHQWMLSGIANGGYKKITVLSHRNNVGTRQISVRLSGGSRHSVLGRVVAIRKHSSSGKTYWFLTALK